MQKTEYASVDKINELCCRDDINSQEKEKFKRYLRLRIGNSDSFKVRYKPSGVDGNGRLFVQTALPSFSSDTRTLIAGAYYHSVSFDNSSNDAITAHLKAWYGATRQNSKPLEQYFRGTFEKLKKGKSLYHEVLYSTENRVLMAMAAFFLANNWSVDTFMFHTILVRRRRDENLTPQLLTGCEKYILEQTGVEVNIKVNQTLCEQSVNRRLHGDTK
jgi:hypothetical protein